MAKGNISSRLAFTIAILLWVVNAHAQTVLSLDFNNRGASGGPWQNGNTQGSASVLPGDELWNNFAGPNVLQPLAPQHVNGQDLPPIGYSIVRSQLGDWTSGTPQPGLFPDLAQTGAVIGLNTTTPNAGFMASAVSVDPANPYPVDFWSAQVALQPGSHEVGVTVDDLAAFYDHNDLAEARFSLYWKIERLEPLPGGGYQLAAGGTVLSAAAGYNSHLLTLNYATADPTAVRTTFQVTQAGTYRLVLQVQYEIEDRNNLNPGFICDPATTPRICGTTAYVGIDDVYITTFPCVLPQVDNIYACQGSVPNFLVKNLTQGTTYKWYDAQQVLLGTGNQFPVPANVPASGNPVLFYVQATGSSCPSAPLIPIYATIYPNSRQLLSLDFNNRGASGGPWQNGNTQGSASVLPGDELWNNFAGPNVLQPLAPQHVNGQDLPPIGYSIVRSQLGDWTSGTPQPGLFPDLAQTGAVIGLNTTTPNAGFMASAVSVDPANPYPVDFWSAQVALQPGSHEVGVTVDDLAAFYDHNDLAEARFSLYWKIERLEPLPGGGYQLAAGGTVLSAAAGYNSHLLTLNYATADPTAVRTTFQVTQAGTYRLVLQVQYEIEDRNNLNPGFICDPATTPRICGTTAYVGIDDVYITALGCQVPQPQVSIYACGPGDAKLAIVSPVTGWQYQWYHGVSSSTNAPVPIQGTTGKGAIYWAPLPAGAGNLPYTDNDYYVTAQMPNGATSPYTRVAVTWYPAVVVPVITAEYPILLVGHSAALSITAPQSGILYSWTGPGLPYLPRGSSVTGTPTVAGTTTYSVAGTGAGGCHAEASITLPVFTLTASDQIACAPTAIPIQLAALPTAGYEYRWYDTATGGTPLASSPAYSASYAAGNRTLYVCIANTATNGESERLPILLTWRPAPANPLASGFSPALVTRGNPVTLPGFTPIPGYTYTWDWNDGTLSTPPPHTYETAGIYTVSVTVTDNSAQACAASYSVPLRITDILCETYLPAQGVQLTQNPGNGTFVFTSACAEARIVFDCISGKPAPQLDRLAVSATAQALQPAVVPAEDGYGVTIQNLGTNPFLVGAGYQQPAAGYTWSTLTTDGANYQAGRFTPRPFTWELSARNRTRAWVPAGRATRYTPNGETVEEENALGIPSAIHMGYRGRALPYITAQNATYTSVAFESFESTDSPSKFEDGTIIGQGTIDATYSHAGRHSLRLPGVGTPLNLPLVAGLPAAWVRGGVRLLVWVRVTDSSTPALPLGTAAWVGTGAFPLFTEVVCTGGTGNTSATADLQLVGQSGEWSLCQVTIAGTTLQAMASAATTQVRIGWRDAARAVWVDDVRLQPADAQATAYVYDPDNLRLLASFDDQHFGLYYQYDSEGRLVRKQVETERGRKTVQETLYNTPKKNK